MTGNMQLLKAKLYYFKGRGKWAYDGEGHVPSDLYNGLTHQRIADANNGKMPGINYDGKDMFIFAIVEDGYPQMIKPEVVYR